MFHFSLCTSKYISFASFIIYYLSSHFDTSCLKLFLKWTLRHPIAFVDRIFETLMKKNRNDLVREAVIGFYRTFCVRTVRCHVLALTRDYPSMELLLLFACFSYVLYPAQSLLISHPRDLWHSFRQHPRISRSTQQRNLISVLIRHHSKHGEGTSLDTQICPWHCTHEIIVEEARIHVTCLNSKYQSLDWKCARFDVFALRRWTFVVHINDQFVVFGCKQGCLVGHILSCTR